MNNTVFRKHFDHKVVLKCDAVFKKSNIKLCPPECKFTSEGTQGLAENKIKQTETKTKRKPKGTADGSGRKFWRRLDQTYGSQMTSLALNISQRIHVRTDGQLQTDRPGKELVSQICTI